MLISFITFPANLKTYRTVEGAEKRAEEGYIYSSLNALNEIMEQNPDSTDVAIKMVDIAMKHGYYDYAVYAFNNYLEGKSVTDEEYDTLEAYSARLERYYNTYDVYDAMMAELIEANPSGENMSGDQMLSEQVSEQMISQLEALVNDSEYDPATLFYYMGYTALEDSERREYFEACYYIDTTYTDAAAQAANSYRREGDLVNARRLLEQAYDQDKEVSSVLRSLAIVELLDGNLTYGLSLAEEAYVSNQEEYYVADTYVIALAANGNLEEATSLKEQLEAEGYEFDEELQDFLNGECTLEDYYIEM